MRPIEELASNSGPVAFRRVDVVRVRIPMLEPFRISSGEVSQKEALIVRISDGDSFGWGESSAMAGSFYSTDTPDTCQRELSDQLVPGIVGQEFKHMAALEEYLKSAVGSPFVRVAVETAAWELLARRERKSLGELFGAQARPVPSGLALGLYDSEKQLRDAVERYRPRQYKRLKIKIKRGNDIALVRRVREWLGDFPLFVDANADYGPEDLSVFHDLDQFGLLMFEQPFGRNDLETAAELQRCVHTPVCLDESVECVQDARRAIALGSCRIVNIKLQRVGGYIEALRIVEECAAHGIAVWMGTMPELGVGSAQAMALASDPLFSYPTDVEPSCRWYVNDVLRPQLSLNQTGCLDFPEGPGLGFEVDPAKLECFAVAQWSFRE